MKDYIFISQGNEGNTYWVDYLNQDWEQPRVLRVEFATEQEVISFVDTLIK